MRAREFPQLLFETIHRAVGEPIIEEFIVRSDYSWSYFKIPNSEKPIAHIGLKKANPTSERNSFGLWGWTMQDPMADTGYLETPCLIITGGPEETGVWTVGRGKSLVEKVMIIHDRGRINLESRFCKLYSEVFYLACELIKGQSIARLTYWEAFKNPEGNYLRPI